MKLVNQAGAEVLPNRGNPAAQPHILFASDLLGLGERGFDSFGDETKLRSTLHRDGRSWIVGEHKDRRVVGRFVAPPAAPALVRPRPSHRAEHVSSENPGSDVLESLCRELVIHAGVTFAGSMHPLEGSRVEKPVDELGTAHAERMLQVLAGTCAEAIDRNRK